MCSCILFALTSISFSNFQNGKVKALTFESAIYFEFFITLPTFSYCRIGAVHSVVFGGFAAKELATRIKHAEPKVNHVYKQMFL